MRLTRHPSVATALRFHWLQRLPALQRTWPWLIPSPPLPLPLFPPLHSCPFRPSRSTAARHTARHILLPVSPCDMTAALSIVGSRYVTIGSIGVILRSVAADVAHHGAVARRGEASRKVHLQHVSRAALRAGSGVRKGAVRIWMNIACGCFHSFRYPSTGCCFLCYDCCCCCRCRC